MQIYANLTINNMKKEEKWPKEKRDKYNKARIKSIRKIYNMLNDLFFKN